MGQTEPGGTAGVCERGGYAGGNRSAGDAGPTRWPAGVDEVGRGPLAGPVVAAAVILDPARVPPGLRDSKRLTPRRRRLLAEAIRADAFAWCVARAEVGEIDQLNVLRASLLAMTRAIAGLEVLPGHVQVDGRELPELPPGVQRADAVIGGDASIASISAASILAKVWRDEHMARVHAEHPAYGFERHKGYPTPDHLQALRAHGPCPLHRRSFAPVAAALAERDGEATSGRPLNADGCVARHE
jgi:ribonuclease HII